MIQIEFLNTLTAVMINHHPYTVTVTNTAYILKRDLCEIVIYRDNLGDLIKISINSVFRIESIEYVRKMGGMRNYLHNEEYTN